MYYNENKNTDKIGVATCFHVFSLIYMATCTTYI